MSFNFPNFPTVGQKYSPPGGPTYEWTGVVWKTVAGDAAAATFIGVDPPPTPIAGQMWWDSDSGKLFIYFDDGNSQQWVEASNLRAALDQFPRQTSGTWLPEVRGGTTAGVGTYTQQEGFWVLQGKLCWINAYMNWNAHTGTGAITIGDLPFAPAAKGVALPVMSIAASLLTFTGQLACRINQPSRLLQPIAIVSNAGVASVAMDAAASITINGVYEVA